MSRSLTNMLRRIEIKQAARAAMGRLEVILHALSPRFDTRKVAIFYLHRIAEPDPPIPAAGGFDHSGNRTPVAVRISSIVPIEIRA